jgi:hypothetical protein
MLTKWPPWNLLPTTKHLNIGYDKTIVEVGTTKLLSLQIDNNLKCKKAHWIYYSQSKFSMLCHEDSHTTLESRYFKINLLCLFPFSHVMCIYILGKSNRQQKSI